MNNQVLSEPDFSLVADAAKRYQAGLRHYTIPLSHSLHMHRKSETNVSTCLDQYDSGVTEYRLKQKSDE